MSIKYGKIRGVRFLGLVLLVTGISMFSGVVTAPDSSAAASTFVILGGGFIFLGLKTMRRMKRLQLYPRFLPIDRMISVSTLAGFTSKSVKVIRNDLNKAIARGYYLNMVYDPRLDAIGYKTEGVGFYVPPTEPQREEPVREKKEKEPPKRVQEVVICAGCSAPNTITRGVASSCEFCGAPLAKN